MGDVWLIRGHVRAVHGHGQLWMCNVKGGVAINERQQDTARTRAGTEGEPMRAMDNAGARRLPLSLGCRVIDNTRE